MFGDLFQLPPIPSSGAICIPPAVKKTEQAKLALNMFWGDDADSINYFVELGEQMRLVDSETWYGRLLQECREGDLSLSNYCFLMGLPTRSTDSSHPADAPPSAPAGGRSDCKDRHKQRENGVPRLHMGRPARRGRAQLFCLHGGASTAVPRGRLW